jgi:hypothetical protein
VARFNEILAGRFNRALQKITGIKGSPPTPQLATEIVPSFALFWGSECRYLEGWYRFGMTDTFGASAANVNAVRIRNPVGSNVVAVFEKILAMNNGAAADNVTITLGNGVTAELPTISNLPQRLDARTNPNPSLIPSKTQAPAPSTPGNRIAIAELAVNTNIDFLLGDVTQEVTLLPGDVIQIQNGIVNNAGGFSWFWRERPLEESELK